MTSASKQAGPWRSMVIDQVAAVRAAVEPAPLVAAALKTELHRDRSTGVHVLAVGKAGGGMLAGLDPREISLRRVCATLPPSHVDRWRPPPGVPARLMACDHPLATERNVQAAREVAAFVASTPPDDLLLVLLSGGASAHLTLPREGLSLDELVAVSRTMMKAGASIRELNACRTGLESLKGGGLARLRAAGRTLVLVLSDVIGDSLEVIGSGPFMPVAQTPGAALAAFDRYVPSGEHLHARRLLELPGLDVAARTDAAPRIEHRVIGNNDRAVDAAVAGLQRRGVRVRAAHRRLEGSVASWGVVLLEAAREPVQTPEAWVVGGEPVVNVGHACGTGGPSQELALTIATGLEGLDGWVFVSYSTDGIDGPTHAAGAVVDGGTAGRSRAAGVDPQRALAAHDSTRALDAAGDLLVTGPTGTNVNHVAVLVRFPA